MAKVAVAVPGAGFLKGVALSGWFSDEEVAKMSSTLFSPANQWSGSSRYTAVAEVDVMVSNTGGNTAHFDITVDDTPPSVPVAQGHPVQPGSSRAMKLKAGDRLWIAGETSVTLGVLTP